ncbi:MAG TPA: UDP-N-acetylmuramoyl-L-alanyl-D-glutamate--2,6-diaminopimelate ligase [Phycisphaeraceae bacterium]
MQLNPLIQGLGLVLERGSGQTPVQDLTDDSRQARPGCLFIARSGATADGRSFIRDAICRGAVAIVAPDPAPADLPPSTAWVRSKAADQHLAGRLAERFFDHPSAKLRLIGVTGTNGKTTTTFLIQHLLNQAGLPCGLIGTVRIDDGSSQGPRPAQLTTPGAIELSRLLANMVQAGCRAAAVEVSSHALHQGRTQALAFAAAVFTNLTGDHLDYHHTLDAYADAKAILFAQLPPTAWAILNAQDPYAARMASAFAGPASRRLWTKLTPSPAPADHPPTEPACQAHILSATAQGSRVQLTGPWGSLEATLPLVGRHNVSNALQAVAAAYALLGDEIMRNLPEALASCPPVPGRLEPVSAPPPSPPDARPSPPAVLVDYAHTHDALENVLRALRPVTHSRLIVLFGCGGDRDKTKRPKMAQVACQLADRVYITSDNPRTEDPRAIIDDILQGVPPHMLDSPAQPDAPPRVVIEPDRAAAIQRCILEAQPGDTVLLAGKGHEDYQIIGTTKRPFDDRLHAAKALEQWRQEHAQPCHLPR